MEYIGRVVLPVASGNAVQNADFGIPAAFRSWTIHVLPVDSATASDVAVEILYQVKGSFVSLATALTGTVPKNKVKPFTSADNISRVRAQVTLGSTPPNGGVVVELFGSRDST